MKLEQRATYVTSIKFQLYLRTFWHAKRSSTPNERSWAIIWNHDMDDHKDCGGYHLHGDLGTSRTR